MRRLAAFVVDWVAVNAVMVWAQWLAVGSGVGLGPFEHARTWGAEMLVGLAAWVAWFGLMEGLVGCALGKALLGLRLRPLGMARASLRALLVGVAMEWANAMGTLGLLASGREAGWSDLHPALWWLVDLGYPLGWLCCLLVSLPGADGASLVDVATRTRVVAAAWGWGRCTMTSSGDGIAGATGTTIKDSHGR